MFEIKNVSRKFNTEYALSQVNLTLEGGLNFIIGASGSGKTTLLRILSGMDKDFEGEVFYCGQRLKSLSSADQCEYYGTKFGFISQNFNLIEQLTVLDNLMIPAYLGEQVDRKEALALLKTLNIEEFAKQKVKKLSGGQKQRVAIARELLKQPEVFIADEPTAALDPKSAQEIIRILRTIAKDRMVIVVSHDTTLIQEGDSVVELDRGEISSISIQPCNKPSYVKAPRKPRLSFGGMCKAGYTNNKRNKGRVLALLLTILISTGCLLVNFSGVISGNSEKMFDDLFATYGDSILDMVIASKFQSAAEIDGESDASKVNQDIQGLYDTFLTDPRVSHVVFMESIYEQTIKVNGNSYKIQGSNMAPMLNKMVAG
ncbi:MAG: ABC transporter ATP-binding protein, partial [Anaerovoracaceae bacterium]